MTGVAAQQALLCRLLKRRPDFVDGDGRKCIKAQWLAATLDGVMAVSAQTRKAVGSKGVSQRGAEAVMKHDEFIL